MHKRNNRLPKRQFQYEQAKTQFRITAICSVCAVVLSGLGAAWLSLSAEHAMLMARLSQNTTALLALVVIPVFMPLALSYVLFLRQTFKVAGPLYRYEKVLESIAAGQLPARVKTREGDQLDEVTEVFSRALQRLQQGSMETHVHAMSLEDLADTMSSPTSQRLRRIAEGLRQSAMVTEGSTYEQRELPRAEAA